MTDIKSLLGAIKLGDLEKVRIIVNDNPEIVFGKYGNDLGTPLHWAASIAFDEAVKLLLTNNAEVNAFDKNGFTPLHYAAANGHMNVVELLLANGADINTKDMRGRTAFQIATKKVQKGIAEWTHAHSLPSLTIRVLYDSGTKLYHEKNPMLTLAALRSDILQGFISKDTKTVFETKIGNNKPQILEGPLINLAKKYPLLEKLYAPIGWHAISGMSYCTLIGIAINFAVTGFLIAQTNHKATSDFGFYSLTMSIFIILHMLFGARKTKIAGYINIGLFVNAGYLAILNFGFFFS